MGLDVYAGPVSRYAGGDWQTVMQQSSVQTGVPVITVRSGALPDDLLRAVADMQAGLTGAREVGPARAPVQPIAQWQAEVKRRLGVDETWDDRPDGEFLSDQPGWWGYGAVLLLAAYDEQPALAPGMKVKRLLGSRTVPAVAPAEFGQAEAFQVAAQAPVRYPTLLRAEWCLPLEGGPVLFAAPTPFGKEVTMGHVSRLWAELVMLNERTLRLDAEGLAKARRNESEPDLNSFEAMAPFGLSVLLATAEFAVQRRAAWILDY
ncbi:MAG TPA: hypothetical protein VI160_11655 [Gemmatimonadales bacterium]